MRANRIVPFLLIQTFCIAANAAESAPTTAPSHVTAVTIYQGTALVTREVAVPAGTGLMELTVNPLPPQTVDSSLFSEGADGVHILSTRYRTRAVQADTRQEVRAKEDQINSLADDARRLTSEIAVVEADEQLLSKLENFTAATMQSLTEKGMLNSDATIGLAKYVMDTRAAAAKSKTELQRQLKDNNVKAAFAQREMEELSAGSNHSERDAVIVVDKQNAAASTVRLNYLVNSSNWQPKYKLRAGQPADPVQVEYLAAIEQQSGEDWSDSEISLSTAEPLLNAAPPFLVTLELTTSPNLANPGGGGGFGGSVNAQPSEFSLSQMAENSSRSRGMRGQAAASINSGKFAEANSFYNGAAALEQSNELLAKGDIQEDKKSKSPAALEGPSVTYHLKGKFTIPSRTDEQLIEVTRLEMKPDYFYKAVPVLTPHVYRLANLTNTSEYVLLPGEATMYVGTDFVGRMSLPLVAIGEQFTAGFGVDPQIQMDRTLVSKSTSIQGGNQVHTFSYRIRVSSFKQTPVSLQVWDRLPHAESESVDVSLLKQSPDLSGDAAYQRADRPNNLLRWDLTVQPGSNAEKAATITYEFKMAYDRNAPVQNFMTR